MRTSSIYSRCPSCHKDGLVQPVQASYRCAVCNFDYLTLAKDQAAREAWMLENLRLGLMYAFFVLHLHRLITARPLEESDAQVMAFAEKNGIQLPKGKPVSVKKILLLAFGGMALLAAAIAILHHFLG